MAMNMASSSGGGGRRGRRKAVMAEINVTPLVDVMLVLLIIFMVAAPLLTMNIQVDLPQAGGGNTATKTDNKPLELTVKNAGGGNCVSQVSVLLGETPVSLDELGAKIQAVKDANNGTPPEVNILGDRDACYSEVVKVLGRARDVGIRANIVILPEQNK
jgi:biopolymer transport protein TolR